MSSFFKFKKKKFFLNISSPTLLQWSSQIPGRRGWTTPSSKQQTFLTYEAAQWRNGGLRKARALLPTSEFSWPDHVDLNLCAGGEESGCFNAVKSDQPLPSKEDTGGTPLEPRPCSTTCFRMKGKMEFAGTAVHYRHRRDFHPDPFLELSTTVLFSTYFPSSTNARAKAKRVEFKLSEAEVSLQTHKTLTYSLWFMNTGGRST